MKWALIVLVVAVVAALVWLRSRFLLVTVRGDSMMPSLRPDARVLARVGGRYRTGSVVVFRSEHVERVPLMIKRVAAVAGEVVPEDLRSGVVSDEVVPAGSLLVRGDNPTGTDSRTFGYVRESSVLGRVLM